MSEATLTFEQISSYSNLKNAMESYRNQGYTKVTFPELSATQYGYGIVFYEIQLGDSPIKSPRQVDFNGWTIKVKNSEASFGLFDLERRDAQGHAIILKDLHVTKHDIDSGDFRACPELATGRKLLIVKDEKEWTYRTDSNNQVSFPREDAILIVDGKAVNKPIAPYDTPSSAISYHYYDLDNDVPIRFSHLTFKRDVTSSHTTNLLFVQGYNDVLIENITIGFTDNSITGHTATGLDRCINVFNCSNVKLRNININGTYSASNTAGYGFYLQTVFNLSLYNVNGQAMWGVTNMFNINRMYLNHCTLNRLDIHCYGRDIRCYDCTFENTLSSNKYNQFSSFYGLLHYESCTFNGNFIPALLEASYHAFTGFDLVLQDCTYNATLDEIRIVSANFETELTNGTIRRAELQEYCLPNVQVINLKYTNSHQGNSAIYIYYIGSGTSTATFLNTHALGYVTQVSLNYHSQTQSTATYHHFSTKGSDLRVSNHVMTCSMAGAQAISNQPTEV